MKQDADKKDADRQQKKIGILGGTFNPVHLGHLILAEEARMQFDLDQILFIPNHIPPHRNLKLETLASDKDRCSMLLLATMSNPYFNVSKIELDKEEISYTIHTLEDLKRLQPENSFYFICGTDALLMHNWYRFDDLIEKLHGFILADREGEGIEKVREKIKTRGLSAVEKIKRVDMISVGISSTSIRTRLQNHQSIRYLTPEPVEEYMIRNNLYGFKPLNPEGRTRLEKEPDPL
jgi:nicotinate-nucleotide adenylyltransferase